MTGALRSAWAWPLAALLLLAPRASQACYVCMSGRDDETRTAFLLTTVFLSVLPLLFIGGLVWWLRRRARALEAEGAEPVLSSGGPARPAR